MKIAFPVMVDLGLKSSVYGHFGSASGFLVVDTDSSEALGVKNEDEHHAHGKCQPLKALGGTRVDAVVVGGIGYGALSQLQVQGIKVFRAVEGTVKENLSLLEAGRLPEFSINMTCAGHHSGGGCEHSSSKGEN
jgi:predicted Fe-Mo cluster-binding NifX family protein